MKTTKLTLLSLFSLLIFSCDKDNDMPEIVNEEELITSFIVTLTAGGNEIKISSVDLDGDGPNPPVVTVSPLKANTTYSGVISLLNESVSPVEDITEEVKEEAEEHQFFYTTTGAINSITATDNDVNNNPLGVSFNLVTGAAGAATAGFTLRHEPKKPNSGLADAGGDTDIAVSFTLTVVE